LLFLSVCDVVCVNCADNVEQAGSDDVFRPVISRGELDSTLAPVHRSGYDVQSTCSQIADETEHVQQITGVEFIDFSVHEHTEYEENHNGAHEKEAANPAPLDEVSGTGYEPSECRGKYSHGGKRRSCIDGSSSSSSSFGHFSLYDLYQNKFRLLASCDFGV